MTKMELKKSCPQKISGTHFTDKGTFFCFSKTVAATSCAIIMLVGCKTTTPPQTLEKESLTPRVSAGILLEFDKNSINSSKFSLRANFGTLQLWTMLSTPELDAKIKPRIAPYHLGQSIILDNKSLRGLAGAITAKATETSVIFLGLPGTGAGPITVGTPTTKEPQASIQRSPDKSIVVLTKFDRQYIDSQIFSNAFFTSCPTTFFADDSPLAEQLKAHSGSVKFALETAGSERGAPIIDRITVRPKGLSWMLHCTYAISWTDIVETKIMADLEFELHLDGDKVIFPQAQSSSNHLPSHSEPMVTENGTFGTRFQKDYSAPDLNATPNYHWNPRTTPIVIDDLDNTFGQPFANSEQGQWIQEAIKIATADLRIKFPALGSRIALRSEKPALTGTIAFGLDDRNESEGTELIMLDDKTGELRQVRIILGKRYQYFGHPKMLAGFAENGLLENVQHAVKESFLTMGISEVGGALGLRPNYSGYGAANNWGNDLQSVMSFVEMALPMEFLTDRLEWKEHDILSFKILYANLDSETKSTQAQLLAKAMTLSLSSDEMLIQNRTGRQSRPFQQALLFLETTTQPQVAHFRAQHPDWKEKMASIYLEAYGSETALVQKSK